MFLIFVLHFLGRADIEFDFVLMTSA